jgi:hypothetical protein
MAKVVRRKRKMVDELVAMHLEQYRASGVELIMGSTHSTTTSSDSPCSARRPAR